MLGWPSSLAPAARLPACLAQVVAIWLADHPREMLPILGETAK